MMRKFIMWTSWSRHTAPTQRRHPCLWSRWTRPPWRRLLLPHPWGSSSSSRLCPCTWCQLWKRTHGLWSVVPISARVNCAIVPNFESVAISTWFHKHEWCLPPLRPDCIIIRRLTVSKGYEIMPAAAVTVWAIIQLTTMCVFLGSGSIPVWGRSRVTHLRDSTH